MPLFLLLPVLAPWTSWHSRQELKYSSNSQLELTWSNPAKIFSLIGKAQNSQLTRVMQDPGACTLKLFTAIIYIFS